MAELIEKIADQLGIHVRLRGGLQLIAREDCERIVQACKAGSACILGIEAFRLTEKNVIPEMDFIADFSELDSWQWDDACLKAASSSESYFREVKGRNDLWFEFTLKQRQ